MTTPDEREDPSQLPKTSPRLAQARKQVLARAGGTLSVDEAARLTGRSEEGVRAMIARGELLSIRGPAQGLRLPQVQFSGREVVPGLERVLNAMHVTDDWMRVQLLVDDDVRSALESGRIDDAVRIVRAYLPSDEGGGESIDEDG